MCLSVATNDSMKLTEYDLSNALNALNNTEKYLPLVMRSVMTTMGGEERDKVVRAITRKKEVGYVDLLRSLSYCLSASRLNEILSELLMEEVIVEHITKGKRRFTRA